MRKCVSMVAVASAALGLAACSAQDRPREPAGAAQPLSARAASHADHAQGAPLAAAPAAASDPTGHAAPAVPAEPAVPAASGAVPGQPGSGQGARHEPAGAVVAPVPVLIPSGTTDVAPHSAHHHAPGANGAIGAMLPAGEAAPALVPASARPAPPPPAQERQAPEANIGYDPNAAASAQIMNAVAAAHADGKGVLLDFGANWCTACRALDKAMHTPKVQAVLAQSYHVVQIDLGSADSQHMALADEFAAAGTFGMPMLVVLNPDGTVRANSALTGQPKYEEAALAAWLSQWAPR